MPGENRGDIRGENPSENRANNPGAVR